MTGIGGGLRTRSRMRQSEAGLSCMVWSAVDERSLVGQLHVEFLAALTPPPVKSSRELRLAEAHGPLVTQSSKPGCFRLKSQALDAGGVFVSQSWGILISFATRDVRALTTSSCNVVVGKE